MSGTLGLVGGGGGGGGGEDTDEDVLRLLKELLSNPKKVEPISLFPPPK
jgi:hypothetical protein